MFTPLAALVSLVGEAAAAVPLAVVDAVAVLLLLDEDAEAASV
jgi:hypothetical protein